MIDLLNILCALATIAFGAFGFLSPRFTAGVLDLKTDGSTMGYSELRASVGGGFVVLGLACLWLNDPMGYFMMGIVYIGLTLGRGVSIVIDKPPFAKASLYFAIELIIAAFLIWANA